MPKLTRAQWLKTPYAKSEARDPDGAIRALLGKYGVRDVQWTEAGGPSGRPACMLRFILKGKTYRVMIESLDAQADAGELLKQVKRAIYFMLKSTLEITGVFCSAEQALFAWLELPGGQTLYEGAAPHLAKLNGPDFSTLLLPAPKGEGE